MLDNLYKRIVTMGRPDPSIKEKATSKKPSHSSTDMYHILNGLKKNLINNDNNLKSLQLIKVRPLFCPQNKIGANKDVKKKRAKSAKELKDDFLKSKTFSTSLKDQKRLKQENKEEYFSAYSPLFEGLAENQNLQVLKLNHL